MDFIKRIYTASIVLSLAFFAACGDSESTDITTPSDPSGTDIVDSSSSSSVEISSPSKDQSSSSSGARDVSSSSANNNVSSSSTGNNSTSSSSSGNNSTISSSSDINSTSSSSSINGSEIAEGCFVSLDPVDWRIVGKDTVYMRYIISCDGVSLGYIYNETNENLPIAAGGQKCTLDDHLDGTVDVTCGTNTYTANKPSDMGVGLFSAPELVSCKDTDLWCYSPIIDGADKSPITQMTYRENEGFFFASTGTHDLTDWNGICITYTSDTAAYLIMDLGETKNQELNNNLPQVTLKNKAPLPTERCFGWKAFKQPRWASPAISGNDAAKTIASFKIDQPSGSNFNLIRIRAYRNEDHSFDRTCGDMWCAEYAEETVITDCGNDPVGVWKSTTDATSSVIWPAKLGHEFNPISLLPVIEIYNSVAGTFNLGNGENPYAKVGFDMSYNSDQNFDITKWGGFCITYKSSHDFFAELTPSNATEGQKIPRVLVPRSLEYTTIDLPWSSFSPSDASTVNFVNFVFSEPAGATGYFAFYTVGKPGTCTK